MGKMEGKTKEAVQDAGESIRGMRDSLKGKGKGKGTGKIKGKGR
ncbi:hypothetical protein GCM10010211_47730 [Streptomyces albospinus]|uniref:CsbD family protein n=1 Tax=Streptomyces albospinus TaxID=285515 RepID=A0ABQ2VB39_9ACTN|nr:hypothetical protein [Streptomyces albospinus]GGU76194.1 hypothetical protein GCM10010211_47730 [Streptomyces albospinus]